MATHSPWLSYALSMATDDLFFFIVLLWTTWIAANVLVFFLAVLLSRPDYPHFNGFRVYVPAAWRERCAPEELHAVIEHELGHRARHHVWINLLRLCLLSPVTAEERVQQELEADDCVSDPAALANALARMSGHPLDVLRVQRLRARAAKGRQEAGSPALGMSVHHP